MADIKFGVSALSFRGKICFIQWTVGIQLLDASCALVKGWIDTCFANDINPDDCLA